jgi:hypothetical protein
MELGILVPISAFLGMVALFVVVLRRTGRVIAESRDTEAYRRSVRDLATRVDISFGGIVERIDAVRRHQLPPAAIAENLAAALDAVARYADEAAALDGPSSAASLTAGMVGELARAERALRMVEHGCVLVATARGIGRDIEGETAVKRGYLNLIHAREAFAAYATEIAETGAGAEPRWYSRRRNA